MVELRLESLDAGSLPQDCYVSVRVGETQKLSKLTGMRTLRFPTSSDRRLGKIEVFKRVGACSIEVHPAASAAREVRIDCSSNVGELGLRVHLEADAATKHQADAATKQEAQDQPEASKGAAKMKAYKEYLGKHGLEVLLSEAMSAVLRQRPDQPVDFLVEHLKQCKPFPVVEKPVPVPVAEKPALVEAQHAPKEASSPAVQQAQAPAAKQAPSGQGTYYATNVLPQVDKEAWSNLYAGFPQARKPEKAIPEAAPAFSPARAAAAVAPMCMSPSVGTWLVSKRRAPGPINPTVPMLLPRAAARSPSAAADAPVAAPVVAPTPAASALSAAAAPWPLKPSVGTWLAVARWAPKAAVCEAPPGAAKQAPSGQGTYYACNVLPHVGKEAWSNLYAGFPQARKPEKAIPELTAELAAPWPLKPSVCTWISHLPPPKAGDARQLVKTPAGEGWRHQRGRCLAELASPKAMTLDQRVEVERIISAALLDAGGSLAGEYFPLSTSKSFAMRPGGMSEDDQRNLAQAGLLFKAEEADGRGVFATLGWDAAVWLNAHDHHVTFVAASGHESGAAEKVKMLEDAVNEAVRLLGYTVS